jgi:hypothetical protein
MIVLQACPSRRRVLAAGATTAALLVTAPAALTGCRTPAPEGPDPLESPARRAEADAALAAAVAERHSRLAPAATAFATDRRAHVSALHAELRRVRPSPAASTAVKPAAVPSPPPAVSPDPATARSVLIQAMHAAQDDAATLVMTLPGYRAALMASISACCATHAALLS